MTDAQDGLGIRRFNFSFIVPSSTAAYQRCNYGRCRTFVKATVDFSGALAGSCASKSVALYISASPVGPGELPEPTNLMMQHFHDELGPVGVQFCSPWFTVASLANVTVTIPSPPSVVKILTIEAA